MFADGDVVEARASVVEQVDDGCMWGGTLRRRYAAFLADAGRILDADFSDAARAYETAADRWAEVAAVCRTVPAVDEASRLSLKRREAVARGDAGDRSAKAASESLESLLGSAAPLSPDAIALLFGDLSGGLRAAVAAEREALETLRSLVG